ncbi:hypothetical protein [Litoreibacter roseus]|uniref:Uncharacterized protein n=1 Tax=Litoreibacter roseus TaxID=2601869 RepID=A0A6N6JM60_9RHOB|nr:hypothetical protein [Litoreibacter roseus]GFE67386.1 hypothetical protein KIN_44600 [Litoreibacter roseus]
MLGIEDLIKRTQSAANAARLEGFENTALSLAEIARDIQAAWIDQEISRHKNDISDIVG